MVLLGLVVFLIVLAILAERFGYDSREGMQSKEAELACFGMEWPGSAVPLPMPVLERPTTRRRRVRRALASRLYVVAEWLSPGTSASLARS